MGVFTVRFDTDNAVLVVINPLGAVVVVATDATRPRPSNRLARHAPDNTDSTDIDDTTHILRRMA